MAAARRKNGSSAAEGRPAARRRRIVAGIAAAGLAGLAALSAVVFQDNLARFSLNPRTPFQTQEPPPAPDYGGRDAWALWPDASQPSVSAEIFYVHSTVYYSSKRWNAPIGDAAADAELRRNALPNEAGPFLALGPVFAPRYRQATLFSFFTHKFDGVAARKLAYEDVKSAFASYLATADPKKPLVLVGYGQGGLHMLGLLKDFFQTDAALRGRLAAAYIVDQATPTKLFSGPLGATPPCASASDIRCVVSFVDVEQRSRAEADRARRRSMAWTADGDLEPTAGQALLCVNPLAWTTAPERAGSEIHVGAASATGLALGSEPPAIAKVVGAQCQDGVLIVDRPPQAFLRRGGFFGEKWRARSYNLFYYDLAENAERRVAATAAKMEEEYLRLDPIADSVDLEKSPVHKTRE